MVVAADVLALVVQARLVPMALVVQTRLALSAPVALVVHPVVHGEAGQGGDGLGVGLRPHRHGLVPGLQ